MGLISRMFGTDSKAVLGTPGGGLAPLSRPTPFDTYDPAQRVLPDPWEPFLGGIPVADPGLPLHMAAQKESVEWLWRSQPNVRKVVDFCARNIASIPLHVFERVSDTNRQRVTDGVLAGLMTHPAPRVGSFRFWHGVLSDGLLYDRWAVMKVPTTTGMTLVPIPSWRLYLQVDALRRVTAAWYYVGDQPGDVQSSDVNGYRSLDLDTLIFDHGYAPMTAGLSPLDTLRDVLAESAEAVAWRRQHWANGPRVPGYLYRPAGAPDWAGAPRTRFIEAFRAAFGRDGERAGGVPLLEDGMELRETKLFTPQDAQDIEGRRLTAIEVAAAFHIAPELVGAQQGNYSNVREFRQMLYRDSLGPYIVAWEEAVDGQLVPDLADGRPLYVEANVESKLRGSFEEQATILSSAVGAPWMTRAEARARGNLPELPGADQLVVPLNVLLGGQASPRDSAPPATPAASGTAARGGPLRVKAAAPDPVVAKAVEVLTAFFERQGRSVASAGGDWDDARWNKELADELAAVNVLAATAAGRQTLEALGLDPAAYDEELTLAWLRANAEGSAETINETTRGEVQAAVAADDTGDAGKTVAALFTGMIAARAVQVARTQVTAMAGFGSREAVQQSGVKASKTWDVRSSKPRKSHARMNGETVPVGELFSNGSRWPGDSKLHPDERSGCTCEMTITRES
jgi:HK97 family phage portal protein